MKFITRLLTGALVITIQAAPSPALNITAGFSEALSEVAKVSHSHPNTTRFLKADFIVSKFDKQIVEAFAKAWQHSEGGTSGLEGVVLIVRTSDGSYNGVELGRTNEHKKFTFRWQAGTIAIVHTHPNSSDPKPQEDDLGVADKFDVPIFTITSRGMYVYDPSNKKISKVIKDLDWLNASKFSEALTAAQ